MVEKKKGVLEDIDYIETLKYAVGKLKEEKNNLEAVLVALKIKQRQTEDNINKLTVDFEMWRKKETGKLEQEKIKYKTEAQNHRDKIQAQEEEITKRLSELRERELVCSKVTEERKQLALQRIEVAKLEARAKEEITKTEALSIEAQRKLDFVSIREKTVEEIVEKGVAAKNDLISREEQLKTLNVSTDKKLNDLAELRKALEPRIEELKLLEVTSQKAVEALKRKENEIDSKLNEDKEILRKVATQVKINKDKEVELATREEEVFRRELSLKNKK